MNRFDEDESEPVAVVRVFGDFAMTLSVTLMLLVGTRAESPHHNDVQAQPTVQQAGAANLVDLRLAVAVDGRFLALPTAPSAQPMAPDIIAKHWFASNQKPPGTVAVQFPRQMPAGDLHKALLLLQSSMGQTVSIRTFPAL